MATLEPKDSKSTLVEESSSKERAGTPHPLPPTPLSPASPFSASFDPNAPTPQIHPDQIFLPTTSSLSSVSAAPVATQMTQDAWRSSLQALASQFATLASVPAPVAGDHGAFSGALTVLEQAQAKLKDEIDILKEQLETLRLRTPSDKEKEREHPDGGIEGYEARFQAVEKKVEEIAEAIRIEWVLRVWAMVRLLTCVFQSSTIVCPTIERDDHYEQNGAHSAYHGKRENSAELPRYQGRVRAFDKSVLLQAT